MKGRIEGLEIIRIELQGIFGSLILSVLMLFIT